MEVEVKKLLEDNLDLNKKNNELLHKVYRIQKWAQISRMIYWLVIIAAAFGAFYFLKPLFGNIFNTYTESKIDSLLDMIS